MELLSPGHSVCFRPYVETAEVIVRSISTDSESILPGPGLKLIITRSLNLQANALNQYIFEHFFIRSHKSNIIRWNFQVQIQLITFKEWTYSSLVKACHVYLYLFKIYEIPPFLYWANYLLIFKIYELPPQFSNVRVTISSLEYTNNHISFLKCTSYHLILKIYDSQTDCQFISVCSFHNNKRNN